MLLFAHFQFGGELFLLKNGLQSECSLISCAKLEGGRVIAEAVRSSIRQQQVEEEVKNAIAEGNGDLFS